MELVATDPPHQGKGHMGQLLRAINRVADAERIASYLECSGERNKALYEHFGYVCKGAYPINLEDDEPGWEPNTPVYTMLRQPAA